MSNTVFYIVVFVVIAHFIAGFVFLVRKLSGPVSEEALEDQQTNAAAASKSEAE